MADNYLENRYNEVFGKKKVVNKIGHSINSLLNIVKSENVDFDYHISEDVVNRIISVGIKDFLFFIIYNSESLKLFKNLGFVNRSYIILETDKNISNELYITLGKVLQLMQLKAAEIGYIVRIEQNFDLLAIKANLSDDLTPLSVVTIGKLIK